MLVNVKSMIEKAYKNKYAIPHININNLEWTKSVLEAAQETNSPLIIGVSKGAISYMGGFTIVKTMVESLVKDLNITVPVSLHLDHGKYEDCLKAIESGFTSIMFDGSNLPFEENFNKSKELINLAKTKNISVEVEVGKIGGGGYGMENFLGEISNIDQVIKIASLNPDIVAVGIGNVHGVYPPGWKNLAFDKLESFQEKVDVGFVLHGGSGIEVNQIKKAISLGIVKINVNTELQQAYARAIKDYILNNDIEKDKNYDPRKLLKNANLAIKKVVKDKIYMFGSDNKA